MEERLAAQDTPEALALDVLKLSRSVLLVELRFFDLALSRLVFVPGGDTFAADGERIWFNAAYVLLSYREEKERIVRAIAHMVLHCVFRHMYVSVPGRRDLWDLACDISVENVIADLGCDSVVTLRQRRQALRLETMKAELGVLTAEKLYRWLCGQDLSGDDLDDLRSLFVCDDHSVWYGAVPPVSSPKEAAGAEEKPAGVSEDEPGAVTGEAGDDGILAMPGEGEGGHSTRSSGADSGAGDPDSPQRMSGFSAASKKESEAFWNEVSLRMQQELDLFLSEQGNAPGALTQYLKELRREKRDYSSFLRRFAVLSEAVGVNDSEFDPVYYTYGLNVYGDLPLVEPLEWQESRRVRELVVAIDTSGSVAGETVRRFVERTYDILMDPRSFSRRFVLHIIQCDAAIREDRRITSRGELSEYLQSMVLHGFGGTDFRPVFAHVDKLIATGELRDPGGLLYFTDGRGIYPRKKPAYKTAFIFLNEAASVPDVPPWAIRLVLRKDDFFTEDPAGASRRAAR